jgi:SAM-dependent methyltransferase
MKFETTWERAALEEHLSRERFYHSFEFTNGCAVRGAWDVARSIEQYQFPKDLLGKRVLDIGPASGFFSFYLEAQGAKVTALEAHSFGDCDVYGTYRYAGADGSPPDRIQNGLPVWFGHPASSVFWKIHDAINSRVEWRNGKIYDANPSLTGDDFDLIFAGSLLLHLRDPIGALRAARSVCTNLLVTTIPTWAEQDENPVPMQMLPYTHLDRMSWWMPNKAALRHWLLAAGFRQIDIVGSVTIHPDREVYSTNGVRVNSEITEQVVHARI